MSRIIPVLTWRFISYSPRDLIYPRLLSILGHFLDSVGHNCVRCGGAISSYRMGETPESIAMSSICGDNHACICTSLLASNIGLNYLCGACTASCLSGEYYISYIDVDTREFVKEQKSWTD